MSEASARPEIAVVTHFPSPYQVELFNEIERQRPGALRVYCLFRRVASRNWTESPSLLSYTYLEDDGAMAQARRGIAAASFAVLNYYNDRRAAELIRVRAATGLPWCFWGEPPGYRFPFLARLARRRRLAALRATDQPIWGIGQWAVDEYRKEFGNSRRYVNLPYFSDLCRFQQLAPRFAQPLTFLYSGALSHRKGVDVLARAFRRLSQEHSGVRLKVMGAGNLESSLRRALGGSDRVEWAGFKDWSELPPVYASAQVLCVPSRHDGWGLVVPEGLASGLPTIATSRTGAARDLIVPGRNGWLVPPDDVEALLGAMRSAAALTEQQWLTMSAAARDSVRDHSLSQGAERFLRAADDAMQRAEVRG